MKFKSSNISDSYSKYFIIQIFGQTKYQTGCSAGGASTCSAGFYSALGASSPYFLSYSWCYSFFSWSPFACSSFFYSWCPSLCYSLCSPPLCSPFTFGLWVASTFLSPGFLVPAGGTEALWSLGLSSPLLFPTTALSLSPPTGGLRAFESWTLSLSCATFASVVVLGAPTFFYLLLSSLPFYSLCYYFLSVCSGFDSPPSYTFFSPYSCPYFFYSVYVLVFKFAFGSFLSTPVETRPPVTTGGFLSAVVGFLSTGWPVTGLSGFLLLGGAGLVISRIILMATFLLVGRGFVWLPVHFLLTVCLLTMLLFFVLLWFWLFLFLSWFFISFMPLYARGRDFLCA